MTSHDYLLIGVWVLLILTIKKPIFHLINSITIGIALATTCKMEPTVHMYTVCGLLGSALLVGVVNDIGKIVNKKDKPKSNDEYEMLGLFAILFFALAPFIILDANKNKR